MEADKDGLGWDRVGLNGWISGWKWRWMFHGWDAQVVLGIKNIENKE